MHVHPSDRPAVQEAWALAVQTRDLYDVEFRIKRHDGIYRWFKTRAVPLRDGTGSVVKWFGSSTDIDDYKKAERKLRTQLERLALLDRTTRAIGSHLDQRSILQIVLRSLEEQLAIDFGCVCHFDAGRSRLTVTCVGAESAGLAEQLAMSESTQVEIEQNGLSRCVAGELVYESDLAKVDSAFAQRFSRTGLGSLVMAPLTVESIVFGVLVVARRGVAQFSSGDCDFLRQLSDHVALATQHAELYTSLETAYEDLRNTQHSMMQQDRLRVVGQMASGVAHDINNTLSPAALYTQLLRERDPSLSDTARDQLAVVQRAIEDVSHTVARLRDFYRPHQEQAEPTAVDLHLMLEQVIQLTRARWLDIPQERGVVIRLERKFAASLPHIMGVENEIRDALTNLILNAVDAMPAGGTLTLRSRLVGLHDAKSAAAHHSSAVHVEVCDTGVGMDEQARTRCLEPFFTTKGERGTGLGLAMVYGMAQRHSADIEIDSSPGIGTAMRLIFYTTAESGASGRAMEMSNAPTRQLCILLVDDDSLILEASRSVLEREGHTIVIAEGGKAGIESFQQAHRGATPFDVVITDLGMPYVDGRQVAMAVKTLAPRTPVILLTGWGQRMRTQHDIPEHVDRVLGKPPKLPELRKALADFDSQFSLANR
jgi:signal transduction histidine kinase/ActR/RegA family two-component response regulator